MLLLAPSGMGDERQMLSLSFRGVHYQIAFELSLSLILITLNDDALFPKFTKISCTSFYACHSFLNFQIGANVLAINGKKKITFAPTKQHSLYLCHSNCLRLASKATTS